MSSIRDITPSGEWVFKTSPKAPCLRKLDRQGAAPEIHLDACDRARASYPVIVRQLDDCNFVVFKSAERKYRRHFFDAAYAPVGCGVWEHHDLTECTTRRRQTRADRMAGEHGESEKIRR